jgi:hypothetical protein
MERNELSNEGILKEENVGYLSSKVELQGGTLLLTPKRLVLKTHRMGGLEVIKTIVSGKIGKHKLVFNLEDGEIVSVKRGKSGPLENVLEITDIGKNVFRIIVGNYQEWEDGLIQNLIHRRSLN